VFDAVRHLLLLEQQPHLLAVGAPARVVAVEHYPHILLRLAKEPQLVLAVRWALARSTLGLLRQQPRARCRALGHGLERVPRRRGIAEGGGKRLHRRGGRGRTTSSHRAKQVREQVHAQLLRARAAARGAAVQGAAGGCGGPQRDALARHKRKRRTAARGRGSKTGERDEGQQQTSRK